MNYKTLLAALAAVVCATAAFAIRIENAAPSGISRTNAIVAGDLVITNGTTNVVYVTVYYAKSDYTTNTASWTYTNTFSVSSTGAVSTNIMSLAPATKYYYRWYVAEGTNTDWPAYSTNFTTLAGAPTGAAPAVAYHPVMESTNGGLAAGTNFFAMNTGRLSQAQVALLPDLAAHTGALGVAVHGLGSAATNASGDFATAAQGAAATNAQERVNALDSTLTGSGGNIGVNTNAPGVKFEVNGSVAFSALPTSTNGFTVPGTLWTSNSYLTIWSP